VPRRTCGVKGTVVKGHVRSLTLCCCLLFVAASLSVVLRFDFVVRFLAIFAVYAWCEDLYL